MRYSYGVGKMLKRFSMWCNRHEGLMILLFAVVLLRIPSLFTPHYYGDEEIYFVMGRAWREGVSMYQSMFDHKPPLLYVLAGIAQGVFWFRAMLMATMLVHTVVFYKLARLLFSKRPKLAFVSALIFVILTSLPTFEGNIVNAELFMMLPITWSLLVVFKAKQTDWRRFLFAGLIAGVGWLFKVPVVADFVAITLYLFAFRAESLGKSIRAMFSPAAILFIVGFVAPLASSFIYYAMRGIGQSYLDTVLTMNLGYVSSWSTGAYSFNPFQSGIFVRGLAVAFITLLIYALRKKLDRGFVLTSLWFVFSLWGALLSGRPYPHYLQEPFVPLSLLIPYLFVIESVWGWGIGAIILLSVGYVSKQIGFWTYDTWGLYKNFIGVTTGKMTKQEYVEKFDGARRNYAIGEYLNERLQEQEEIYLWSNDAAVYNLTNRLPAGGKYIVDFHVRDLKKHDYVMENLRIGKPKYIVVFPGTAEFPQLEEFLERYYMETFQKEGAVVYMRQGEW